MKGRRYVQPEIEGAEQMLAAGPRGGKGRAEAAHATYVALCVLVHGDGSWRVHEMRKTGTDPHVLTEWLDAGENGQDDLSWARKLLREYAGDVYPNQH